MIDLLIIGAGPVGCVVAEHASRLNNWNCLIVDKATTLQVTALIPKIYMDN